MTRVGRVTISPLRKSSSPRVLILHDGWLVTHVVSHCRMIVVSSTDPVGLESMLFFNAGRLSSLIHTSRGLWYDIIFSILAPTSTFRPSKNSASSEWSFVRYCFGHRSPVRANSRTRSLSLMGGLFGY